MVYIQEAHPTDAWSLDDNSEAGIEIAEPTSLEARSGVAGTCVIDLGIEFPAVVDDIDNRTERAYTGWPDRLYLIDKNGRVAYKSRPGPYGFKPAELEVHLQSQF